MNKTLGIFRKIWMTVWWVLSACRVVLRENIVNIYMIPKSGWIYNDLILLNRGNRPWNSDVWLFTYDSVAQFRLKWKKLCFNCLLSRDGGSVLIRIILTCFLAAGFLAFIAGDFAAFLAGLAAFLAAGFLAAFFAAGFLATLGFSASLNLPLFFRRTYTTIIINNNS